MRKRLISNDMAIGGGQYANLKNGIRYVIFTPGFDIYKGCNVLYNLKETDLQVGTMMTEILRDELGYVYEAAKTVQTNDIIELYDDNTIQTSISYYTHGFPFADAEFVINFQLDLNLDTIINNESYTQGTGYSLEMPSGSIFQIINNQTLYPSFIEDIYFEPQEERYIMILTV